jgi:hypothetical protein
MVRVDYKHRAFARAIGSPAGPGWHSSRENGADDVRLVFAYAVGVGEMKRAIAWEQRERQQQDRFASTVAIWVSIIAAVRLARDDIATPTPTVLAAVADSVGLARMVLKKVLGR